MSEQDRKALLSLVVYEDEAVIAFDKPGGLLIAPDRWDKARANLMGLIHESLSPEYFNAHRLDRETSGLVLCAKTKPALDHLCAQFEERTVRKEYIALVNGTPPENEGVVRAKLAEDPHQRGRMLVAAHGKAAETQYRVDERFRGYALVRLLPQTGRMHQLRVHMAYAGCPIVADSFYGDGQPLLLSRIKVRYKHGKHGQGVETPLLSRVALHAERLVFKHPVTGAEVTIAAPPPDDLALALKYLRRYAAG